MPTSKVSPQPKCCTLNLLSSCDFVAFFQLNTMTSSCNDYEKRIFDALDAYEHGHLPSLSAAAIAYQIQPRTLQRRVKNLFHDSRSGHNKLLTSGQESAPCKWLERIIQLGFPPCLDLIRSRANLLLVDPSQSSSPTVGTNWPSNLLKRQKDFCLCMRI